MCEKCEHWQRVDREWGNCSSRENAFTFTPYTMKPFMFAGTIEQWNARVRPKPTPLTQRNYECAFYAEGSNGD